VPTEVDPCAEIANLPWLALIHSFDTGKRHASNNQDVVLRSRRYGCSKASTAPSNLWRSSKKSIQSHLFHFRRARIVLMFRSWLQAGAQFRGQKGAETGA